MLGGKPRSYPASFRDAASGNRNPEQSILGTWSRSPNTVRTLRGASCSGRNTTGVWVPSIARWISSWATFTQMTLKAPASGVFQKISSPVKRSRSTMTGVPYPYRPLQCKRTCSPSIRSETAPGRLKVQSTSSVCNRRAVKCPYPSS